MRRKFNSKSKKMTMQYHKFKPVEVGDWEVTNDVATIADTERSLQFNVNLCTEKQVSKGVKIDINNIKELRDKSKHTN